MNYTGFRTLNGDERLEKVRNNQKISFVLIKKDEMIFARTVGDKELLKENMEVGDILIMNWMGEYRSDMFILNKDDLNRIF